MRIMENFKKLLKKHGLKVTTQRLTVLKILSESENHLDADTILELATELDPSISLATIYRTINLFKDANLIAARYFARDHKREYYVLSEKEDQYHFTCVNCGEVSTVNTPRIRQAKVELAKELGISFTHACLCFEGYCKNCTEDKSYNANTISLNII